MRLGTFLTKDIMADVTAFQEAVLLPAVRTKSTQAKVDARTPATT